ncbi:MAG: hypothetical protein K6F61_05085 [Clostridiales bacterium]|nr:hypothetical protein [Clostridiales bacterium]
MADVFFDSPPALAGREAEQLTQLQRYLMAMSDKLNQAMMDISIEQMAPETRQTITRTQETSAKQYETLKSMIVKTAEIVRHEMTEITARLTDDYTALSEQFGEYERNLDSEIRATADGILQEYSLVERVTGLEDSTESFTRRINQYIFSGLVDAVNGKYGIAIGENITAYDQDGNPYLNTERKMATFTMDRLSFWQGATELAYFANNIFHIAQGEVTQSMKMGNHTWKILPDGSIGLIGN